MWQIGLNFPNYFALAWPRRAILAFRTIAAVGTRMVTIASIAPYREQSAKCLRQITRIATCARGWRGRLRRASLGQAALGLAELVLCLLLQLTTNPPLRPLRAEPALQRIPPIR
jgi:hypothetical protein